MSEKQAQQTQLPQWRTELSQETKIKKKKTRRLHILLFVLILILWHIPWFPRNPAPPERGELNLGKCSTFDDPFLCGKLITPLDYTNSSDPRNASIAVVVYPAGAGKTQKDDILGSILFNPGGPGGSGLSFLTRRGASYGNRTLAESLDEKFEGKYNLVSFDPRGVGETWPSVECFSNELDSLVFSSSVAANGLPGQHGSRIMKHEIGTTIAQEQLLSDVCQNHDSSHLLRFMGTAFVVRDMQLLHKALGDEKLNYWGFSYGTVLGSTYADMFPEDVNRLIIDGVVDVENYYQGKWSDNFKDIEAEFDLYFDECIASGPDACKLAKLVEPGADGAALKKYVMDYADKLKHHPVALAEADPPHIFTYFMFISGFFQSMYSPAVWPNVAESLYDAITKGDFSKVASSPGQALGSEAIMQIACGDNIIDPGEQSWNITDYEDYIVALREDSPHFSEFFGQIGLMCNGIWPVRAAERHRGDFTSSTSFPLLVLGNDYDPVTPGRYAEKMANKFGNAVSVRREGYGHCSSSQPSKCIDDIVIKYFLKGELPSPKTRCSVDGPVFGGVKPESESLTLSDILRDAIHEANPLLL